MLDASGYGCLAAHRKGERHSASSYKFVTVHSSACYILLDLVSDGDGSASRTALHHVCVCVYYHLLLNIGNRCRRGNHGHSCHT